VVSLRPEVRRGLEAHGIEPGPGDSPESLRERLNDRYLEDVRRLRRRQAEGEIALRDYARHADELKHRYPLLGLPLPLWEE
jgi:hypothetical protein